MMSPLICPACQAPNAEDANFCLNCSYRITMICPRCSQRLLSHANFCDRCGLAQDEQLRLKTAETEKPLYSGQRQALQQVSSLPSTEPKTSRADKPSERADLTDKQPAGFDSPLMKYVPSELMKKLEAIRSSGEMVGERRVVTMMFCDIKGSTAAAEQLDPEEWTEIINGAFEHMIKPVYTYEGTVVRLMGDGILAFFGAPLSHEDDPQRAVLAGLDILAAIEPYREQIKQNWGIDIDVRIGINTGLVVVGAVGSDMRMEYTALGDAINLAARMEQTAAPGTVQVAHDTYKLVKHMFEFEDLGDIEVKGKEGSVKAYRALRRKVAGGRVRGIEGLHADIVGREVELEILRGVVDDLKQGVGRIVFVLGEAGLGKSRLISETRQIFDQMLSSEANWYETSSLSYETHQAYGQFQRLIRRISSIGYDDAPRLIQKKLAAAVEILPEEKRSNTIRLLETLFGISSENGAPPMEGEQFNRELFEIIQAWLRASFSNRPTVLVFDDMHWVDAASVDLIRQLLPLTESIPLVLMCALRSERQAPAWKLKTTAEEELHHRYIEISLRPLSQADSNELVNRLLAVAELPDSLRSNILEKSEGNPFFIEEVVRALIENGVVVPEDRMIAGEIVRYWVAVSDGADFSIPDNLQSLLAARMDQLEETTRATLQLASVIGRSFYLRVLQAVDESTPDLDRHVSTLLRMDMIRESARVPEVQYSFRNPLTQEAVYTTILLKRRREFHRRVAEAMEELYAERLDGLYGLLAHHFKLAGDTEKTVTYLQLASRQARAVFAYDEALQNLNSAVELVDPNTQVELHLNLLEELADIYRLLRDFVRAIALYQQILELGVETTGAENVAAVRLHRKIIQVVTDAKWAVDVETYRVVSAIRQDSRASLQERLRSLVIEPPHPENVLLLAALSTDAWRNQDPPDWTAAQYFAESAVEMAENLEDDILVSRALGTLANTLDGQSMLREHLQIAQRRVEICREAQSIDPRELIDALRGLGMALMYVGKYDEAMPHLKEAEDLAVKIRIPDQIATAVSLQAQCLFRMDRWDEVLGLEEKWRELNLQYTRERVGAT